MNNGQYYSGIRYKLLSPIRRKMLQFKLNMGFLSVLDERYRGIGKTTMLVQKAIETGLPIIVGTQSSRRYVFDVFHSLGYNDVDTRLNVFVANQTTLPNLQGLDLKKGVYIDDTVDRASFQSLKKHFHVRIAGGFQLKGG